MEHDVPSEIVTKIEAAERQLCVAIRLFFERRDMIAVHTLAAAAVEVLRRLGAPRGIKSLLFDIAHGRILPEKRKEFIQIFRREQNFFKHAATDPNEKLNFYPDATKFYLFDAARMLVSLTGRFIPETVTLTAWFFIKYPNWFKLSEFPQVQQATASFSKLNPDDFDLIRSAMDKLPQQFNAGST